LICKDIYRLCGGTTSWKRQAGFVMSLSANHFRCVAIVIIWFKNQSFWSVPPFSLLLDSLWSFLLFMKVHWVSVTSWIKVLQLNYFLACLLIYLSI
jgi:hypothetical protein